MNFQMDLPMPERSLKLLALSSLIDLPKIYFLILRTSDAIYSIDLCKDMA